MIPLIETARIHFESDVESHEMQILHDDGLYRHIRFHKPGTSINHFDLVTWPYHLAISGDCESYTFRRLPDMFKFFAGNEIVNPQYWSEKLVSTRNIKVYSPEKYKELVLSTLKDYEDDLPGILEAGIDELLDDDFVDYESEDLARYALNEFRYKVKGSYTFTFENSWEFDFHDYDFHFLRACHAIKYGVNRYYEEKEEK